MAGQVSALAFNLITSVVIARALGPEGKGGLSLALQVPGITWALLSLGLASANGYFVGTRKVDAGTALANSLVVTVAICAVAIPATVLIAPQVILVDGALNATTIVIICALLPITFLSGYVGGIAIGLQMIRRLAIASILSAGTTTTLIGTLRVVGHLTVNTAVAAYFAGTALSILFVLGPIVRAHGIRRPKIHALREAARYSLKSHLSNLAGYLNYRQDVFLVAYFAGVKAVGIYSVAVTFAEFLWYVPNALSSTIMAKSMAVDPTTGADFTARSSRISLVLMISASVALSSILAPLIGLLYSEAFTPATRAFLLLLPGVFALGLNRILGSYLASQGKLYPQVGMLAVVINLALNIAWIPRMGFNGAALASTVSYAVGGTIIGLMFLRHTGMRVRQILIPTRADFTVLQQSFRGYAERLAQRRSG